MQHLRAIAAHANYLKRVRACLAEEVACACHKPYTDCDFGKWWYAEVFPHKANFSVEAQALINTIDRTHKEFHEASQKITELSALGKNAEAKLFETELMQHSNRLIQAILQLDGSDFSS
ncbi:CZB domain-containing protein [Acidithiobacillus sp.]|uniref:CZB domain-containing protein n=1 Tax=Acidithiobacillus sp. TaxID=1872118 RepID=UPI0025BAF96A|nr:CZB domain-containing protein [Acidithiobacillus sp.]